MSIINTFNNDKFKVIFSNIPTNNPNVRQDVQKFNNYIRGVTLPDYTLQMEAISYGTARVWQPSDKELDSLSPLVIDFQVDEDLENYLAFYTWIQTLRKGDAVTGETYTSKSTIKTLSVLLLDNQKRNVKNFVFTDAIITTLSALTLQYGASQAASFSCTFNYYSFDIQDGEDTNTNN